MITIVGCGPGAAEQLTPAARSAIDNADVLVGARRLLAFRENDGAEKIEVTANIDDAIAAIDVHHGNQRNVAVLVSGDPGIFSLSKRVIEAFGMQCCRVIPGISSVQTAFARIGLGWHDARIISAHHQLPDIGDISLESATKIAILSGRDDVLQWMQKLVDHLECRLTIYACEDLTLESEKVSEVPEQELAGRSFSSRCVFLVIRKDQDS